MRPASWDFPRGGATQKRYERLREVGSVPNLRPSVVGGSSFRVLPWLFCDELRKVLVMDVGRARDEYLMYLAVERGSSPNTIEGYGRDLVRYEKFLADCGKRDVESVAREDVEAFVASFAELGVRGARPGVR